MPYCIAEKYKLQGYPVGKQLFTEQHIPKGVYYIHSGKVKMAVQGKHIVQLAGEGDWVGLDYLFSDLPYKQSAVVIEEARVSFLPLEDLKEELGNSLELLKILFQNINRRMEEVQEWGTLLVQQKTEIRVANILLLIKEKFGCDERNYLNINLTPKTLAFLASTTRTTVYRILSRLKRADVIRTDGNKMAILKQEVLENMH